MVVSPTAKPFRDALRTEIAAAGPNHKALRVVASALIQRAATGDVAAIKELADRLDGKVPQAVVGDPNQPITIRHIAWLGDQTIHDVNQNPENARIINDVTGNGCAQTEIADVRELTFTPAVIELPGQRKRNWAKEHMRKKRAEAKAAREAAHASQVLPASDDDSEKL